MAKKPNPYTDQRKNMILMGYWFLIPVVGLGLACPMINQAVGSKNPDLSLPLFLLGATVVFAALGATIGIRPLINSLTNHNDFKSDDVKSKIVLTGALFDMAALAGVAAWAVSGAWWVYAIGVAALACVVFFVIVPQTNKLYDFLELQLQRKEDGGTVAVAKKTKYDL